jgi:DNA-binding LytR/AlgR family response regulator
MFVAFVGSEWPAYAQHWLRGRAAQIVRPAHPVMLVVVGLLMNLLAHPNSLPMAGDQATRLTASFPQLQALGERPSPRVAIKVKGRILFINLRDVIAVKAEGNYVLLQGDAGSFLLRESISAVAEKVEPYGFIRIHRSVLVNSAFVEEIRPYSTGEYGLRVKGGREFTVTRTFKKNLQSLAEFWIGTSALFPDRLR